MSDVFGKRLGQYVLLEQLGEGGMAKVYNALDARAERNVAIKVILPSKRNSQVFLQQFEQEAKSLANLIHANVVKVLNYGVEDGQPYLVMEYIPGGTLKDAMQRPVTWDTAAAILAPIARALEYVHLQQIIHRDVKPSNILLDEDFRPMLSDFGIVKLLESKDENDKIAAATIGVGVGTPDYMPPEQGMGKDVDFRADIYSLGLVYYEMVTGQKPFAADTPMAAVIRHITDELPLPTKFDKSIPRFVETAMLRAIQKDPADRYSDMGTFAEVLECLALGKDAPVKRILRLAQTHRTKQRASRKYYMLLLLPLFLVLSYFAYMYRGGLNMSSANITSTPPAALGVGGQNNATATITVPPTEKVIEPEQDMQDTSQDNFGPGRDPKTGITLWGVPISNSTSPSQFKEIARWGIGGVNAVEWSPDDSLIALGTTSGIYLYGAESRELVRFIDPGFDVVRLIFNPAGDQIAAGSLVGQVKIWNVQNAAVVRDFGAAGSPSPITSIAYSKNGKNIVFGFANGNIRYFAVDVSSPLMSVLQPMSVKALAISPDNRFLYVSNGDNKIVIWDIALKKLDSEWASPVPVDSFDLSNDGLFLISAGGGNSAYLWDISEERVVSSFSNLGGLVSSLSFSEDDQQVAIGLSNGSIKVFARPAKDDYSKAKSPLVTLTGFVEGPRSVSFSRDGKLIVAGNHLDGLKIWDASIGDEVFTLDGHMRGVDSLYFSPDGVWLATAHNDQKVRIWKLQEAEAKYEFEGYLPGGKPFSPDNRYLTVIQAAIDNYRMDNVQIVELSSGKVVATLPDYAAGSMVQFIEDSKLLIVGDNHSANIWDVSTWERLDTHGGMNAGCGQYFTPENRRVAVIYEAGVLFSYDKKIQDMCGTKPAGTTLVYYFESAHMAFFVLGDGRLWSWDFLSSDIANIRSGNPYPFSNDIFLAADQKSGWYAYVADAVLSIRELRNTRPSKVIDNQSDYLYRVALLPDQKLMALGSQYGSIHIWTMP